MICKEIATSYRNVANVSMQNAAKELRAGTDDVCDVGFLRRFMAKKGGFASLNGLVSIISVDSGKCLDYRVLTKKCAQCSYWENHKNSEEYTQFMMTHEAECLINHRSSAGKMECDGIVDCFVSSVDTRSL